VSLAFMAGEGGRIRSQRKNPKREPINDFIRKRIEENGRMPHNKEGRRISMITSTKGGLPVKASGRNAEP